MLLLLRADLHSQQYSKLLHFWTFAFYNFATCCFAQTHIHTHTNTQFNAFCLLLKFRKSTFGSELARIDMRKLQQLHADVKHGRRAFNGKFAEGEETTVRKLNTVKHNNNAFECKKIRTKNNFTHYCSCYYYFCCCYPFYFCCCCCCCYCVVYAH